MLASMEFIPWSSITEWKNIAAEDCGDGVF